MRVLQRGDEIQDGCAWYHKVTVEAGERCQRQHFVWIHTVSGGKGGKRATAYRQAQAEAPEEDLAAGRSKAPLVYPGTW